MNSQASFVLEVLAWTTLALNVFSLTVFAILAYYHEGVHTGIGGVLFLATWSLAHALTSIACATSFHRIASGKV